MSVAPPTLREIYEAELPYVWNTLRRLGVPERHVEDVAHEVFMVVHRIRDSYDPTRPIRPWLFGISFRTASDFKKRAHFTREIYDPTAERIDSRPNAEALLHVVERRKWVHAALIELDDDLRVVFVLIDIDECSAPEAAATLGIPVNTVYSRLRRARARFEEAVRRVRGSEVVS
ncbi:MAG: sigma-70 family RNA polymerase sigma factor [Deltaproteobacteria bacterium]|nr:sigma-70 family RNA polymerase sigma factor [Deltaproteobacteria bacterium]